MDAISQDGQSALTIIAFIGSVFSPYYAWARQRHKSAHSAPPAAENHCAVNVVLYGAGGKRWAMTERGAADLHRTATTLNIGPSALAWEGDALCIHLDETTVPWPRALRGEVRLHPHALCEPSYSLSEAGAHRWQPIAPSARVEVAFDRPGVRWQGPGYLDSNFGDAPLEDHFVRWDWSRADLRAHHSAVLYDAWRRDGGQTSLALAIDRHGTVTPFEPPAPAPLPPTAWRVERRTRSDAASEPARVEKTLEDTPFYARSLVRASWLGEPVTAMHESLSLDRFASPMVRCMLPFRMPRWAG